MKSSQVPRDYSEGPASTMPRRHWLASLAALVAIPRPGEAEQPGEDTTPPPPAGSASAIFDLERHWRITYDIDADTWSAEPVARWDVPGIGDQDQPLPLHTELKAGDSEKYPFVLFRWWRPEDVARCSLCSMCGAGVNVRHPDLQMCIRFPKGPLSEEDAPLYSEMQRKPPLDG